MTSLDLTLHLPASAIPEGAGELAIAATAHVPAEVDEQDLRVLVCWPGGSYGRDYWDIRLPGRDGYSFAEHMTTLGFVVIAADPLGVGDSGRPQDGTLCSYEALADAAEGATQVLRARLSEGTLADGLAPVGSATIIGVGHSIGGGLVVLQQARWGSYDAIAVLGYTHGAKARAVPSGDDAARRATAVEQAKGFWGDQWEARYGVVDKAPHQNWLNGPDAPADIVAADNANGVVWAAEPYIDALHVGLTAAYAARVAGPVMVAFGEFDIAERPRDEAAFYERSDDITLSVLAGSYHCHNFQDGRARLWDRLAAWATGITAASAPQRGGPERRDAAPREQKLPAMID
jgi:alpha-beta hydrolase superfamily lysophospholipase